MSHLTTRPPLAIGTKVHFDIAEGLDKGEAVIRQSEYDDGWMYLVEVLDGSPADTHRNEAGELWVCEHELTEPPAAKTAPRRTAKAKQADLPPVADTPQQDAPADECPKGGAHDWADDGTGRFCSKCLEPAAAEQ
jgi:hypothetical protein